MINFKSLLLSGVVVISSVVVAQPGEITGKVIRVIDGNTIEYLTQENDSFIFVLHGIDCPELGQEYGEDARRILERLLQGNEVRLTVLKKDRLGNRVGIMRLSKGKDPRIVLLQNGFAWTQERDAEEEFEALKEEAKNKKKGLWKQENPIAPWHYRRQQSMMTPKMG